MLYLVLWRVIYYPGLLDFQSITSFDAFHELALLVVARRCKDYVPGQRR